MATRGGLDQTPLVSGCLDTAAASASDALIGAYTVGLGCAGMRTS